VKKALFVVFVVFVGCESTPEVRLYSTLQAYNSMSRAALEYCKDPAADPDQTRRILRVEAAAEPVVREAMDALDSGTVSTDFHERFVLVALESIQRILLEEVTIDGPQPD